LYLKKQTLKPGYHISVLFFVVSYGFFCSPRYFFMVQGLGHQVLSSYGKTELQLVQPHQGARLARARGAVQQRDPGAGPHRLPSSAAAAAAGGRRDDTGGDAPPDRRRLRRVEAPGGEPPRHGVVHGVQAVTAQVAPFEKANFETGFSRDK
jgi:hypothetical protein